MDLIRDFWGLSLTETTIVAAVILVLLDVFLASDIPSHVAYILICILVGLHIPAPPLVQVMVGFVAWFAILAFHYLFWRTWIQRAVDRFVAPDRFISGPASAVGGSGTIVLINDTRMVRFRGDLWPCRGPSTLCNGEQVRIVAEQDGVLIVSNENE